MLVAIDLVLSGEPLGWRPPETCARSFTTAWSMPILQLASPELIAYSDRSAFCQ